MEARSGRKKKRLGDEERSVKRMNARGRRKMRRRAGQTWAPNVGGKTPD